MKNAILLIGLLGLLVLISGCTQQGKPEPQMTPAPYIDAEATVSSLFLDDLHSDCEAPEVCPRDRVTLKIDKIDRTGDPNQVMNLNVGEEVEFLLKYSARPAKLRGDMPPTCPTGWTFEAGSCFREGCEGLNCPVSSPQYGEKPTEMEDNYIIYHLPQRTEDISETILVGLEDGSKIKIKIWQPSLMIKEIGEYELIS